MPRSRGGAPARSAPSRPTAPARSAPPPQQQQRPYSAAPNASAQQARNPTQTSQSPGLFGQMASTAAGVAVGSSIGHAIGGFFGGGSSAPAEQEQAPTEFARDGGDAMPNSLYAQNASVASAEEQCSIPLQSFTDCMNQNRGNMTICGWYMEQLKTCMRAARQD